MFSGALHIHFKHDEFIWNIEMITIYQQETVVSVFWAAYFSIF